jgi:regulator of protease activity HflC (stomatin/prohibitin superfamily)
MGALKKVLGGALVVAVLIFGLLVLLGSWYTVEQGEIGIIRRAGAAIGEAEPGLHFKVPMLDTVTLVSIRTEKLFWEQIETYSKDIQAANLSISVNYRIDPARATEVYTRLGTNFAERRVWPEVQRQTKEVFGQYNAVSVIIERERLGQEVFEAIRDAVAPDGIIIEAVQIEDIAFSDAFEQSIEARMQAEVEVARLQQNLARERVQADIVRAKAAGEADALKSAADAQAYQIQARAAAEADGIRARGSALRDNPLLIELTKAERWNGILPATMIPGSTVPFIAIE